MDAFRVEQDAGAIFLKDLVFCRGRINLHFVLVAGAATLDHVDAQAISVFCSRQKSADLFRGAIGDRYFSNHSEDLLSRCRRAQAETWEFFTSHFSCMILSWILKSPSVNASGRGGQPGT